MNVEFSGGALGDRQSARFLTAILWLFVEGRHRWCLDDPAVITESRWFAHEAQDVRAAASELAGQAGRATRASQVLVERIGNTPRLQNGVWHVPADAAAWHLARPLLIAVENAYCDGAFLRLILTRVGARKLSRRLGNPDAAALKSAWKAAEIGDGRWLEIRHGGGGTLEKQIRLIAQQCSGLPPRLLVLVDSDRTGLGAGLGQTATDAIQACAEEFGALPPTWKVEPFVLQKREVENYIPVESAQVRYGSQVAQYAALPDADKDYYDLKQVHRKFYELVLPASPQQHLHERAIRARAGNNGRELDQLVDYVVSAL